MTPFHNSIVPIAHQLPHPAAQAGGREACISVYNGPPQTQSVAPATKYEDTAIMQPLYPTQQEFERVVQERDALQERLAASEQEVQRLKGVMVALGTKLIRGDC